MEKIAILMTCFNRKEKTLRCLESLNLSSRKNCRVFLVDDGSTDGTGDAVSLKYPSVTVLKGNGSLFWNGGMHFAFVEAVKEHYDYYLWLNDDVVLYEEFLEKMLMVAREKQNCIVAGYTLDVDEKTVSYGGQRIKPGVVPLDIHMIYPTEDLELCDTMHGNCVLITKSVVEKIGLNDEFYTHGFGDVDYGLTATENGISVYLTNFPVGICEGNPHSNRAYEYNGKNLIERFRIMNSWRHRPVKDWYHFTRKHGGTLWFLRFIGPYIKLIFNIYR